jgi:Ricin-type beta-trefoil lectin domain-like
MKKGVLLLLGLVAVVAIALSSVTGFAALSTRTAQSHKVHIFPHKGHTLSRSATASSGNNIPYNSGGLVMTGTAHVYAIFWEPTGNVSANYNNLIVRYFKDVGGSPLYKNNNQYTQNGDSTMFPSNAVLAGSWLDKGAYPRSPLLDSNIENEVTNAQTVNKWSSNIDNVFFVFTQRNEDICLDSTLTKCASNTFCAYHSFFGTNNTIYATMPYAASFGCNTGARGGLTGSSPNNDDADQTIDGTSHEQMEAATDPLLNAWIDLNTNTEIGDPCAYTFGPGNLQGADVLWNKDPYIVQQEWSNAISGCTLTTNTTVNTGNTYYQIVNRNSGLVMDVSGGSKIAGAQVIQWTNHSGPNQQWALVPDGVNYQIVNVNSTLALDVSNSSLNDLANVIQETPNSSSFSQQWYLVPDGGYDVIANFNSNRVADVSGASKNAGAPVIQYGFKNGLNQQWELVPVSSFEIVNRNSNLLADVSGASINAGAHVIQWPFNNGSNQKWILVSDGAYYQIVNVKSKLVMDVAGASKSGGAQVIQWTNHNGLNQQWSLVPDGDFFLIKNHNSGLVLDVFGASKSGGTNVIQWPFNNGSNQQWSLVPTLA